MAMNHIIAYMVIGASLLLHWVGIYSMDEHKYPSQVNGIVATVFTGFFVWAIYSIAA